jgi:hypothetical protein
LSQEHKIWKGLPSEIDQGCCKEEILDSLKRLIMYAAFGITKRIVICPAYKPRTQTMAAKMRQTGAGAAASRSDSESTAEQEGEGEGEEGSSKGDGSGSDSDCISVTDSEPSQGQGPSQPPLQQQQQQWPPGIPAAYAAPLTNPAVRAWLRASRELVCMRTVRDEVSQAPQVLPTALMLGSIVSPTGCS